VLSRGGVQGAGRGEELKKMLKKKAGSFLPKKGRGSLSNRIKKKKQRRKRKRDAAEGRGLVTSPLDGDAGAGTAAKK